MAEKTAYEGTRVSRNAETGGAPAAAVSKETGAGKAAGMRAAADVNVRMRALGESRSVIRDIFEYGQARRATVGAEKVFDFSLGNPSAPPPPCVAAALERAIKTESPMALHGYTSSPGAQEARAAVAAVESGRAGYPIPPDAVYMTCGAAASLSIALSAVVQPGDNVVLFAPFFPEYRVFAETAGAAVRVVLPEGPDMLPSAAGLADVVDEHTRAVLINSPNNPSGAVYGEATLSAIAAVLREAEARTGRVIYLLSDEPYRELVYDGAAVPFVPAIYPDTLVCYSYSKSLSLPGERIGYILVPPSVRDARAVFAAVCGAGRALGYVCAPSLFQHILPAVCGAGPDLDAYRRPRALLLSAFRELGYTCTEPAGAFYLFVKAPHGDAAAFCARAREKDLLFVPSDSFGLPGYVRIAYCVEEKMVRRALPAIRSLGPAR